MEGPIRHRRIRRRTLRNSGIAVCILVVVLAVFYGTESYLVARARAEHEALMAATQKTAARISKHVDRLISQPAAKIEALAANNNLRALFAGGEKAALARAAAEHGQDIAGLLKLRFLLPDSIELEPDVNPPLGYASLELLSQARNGHKPVNIELHLPGTDSAHIVVVRRVVNETGDLVGMIHASLSPSVLEQAFNSLDNFDGYLKLKQFTGGSGAVTLLQQGEPAYEAGRVSHTIPIALTSWTLTYWPPEATAGVVTRLGGSLLIPAVIVGAILLLLVSVWIVRRRRRAAAERSGEVYDGAVKAFIEGAHPDLGKLVPNMPAMKHKDNSGPAPLTEAPREDARPHDTDTRTQTEATAVPATIFRAYDIRGLVESELTPAVVELLGRAIGSEARDRRLQGIAVGRDGRLSSPELSQALIRGLRSSGIDVIDIGLVATPVLYYATHYLEANSGVMITGSHNGPEYNGLKIVLGGETLSGETVKALYQRIRDSRFSHGHGNLQTADIRADYIRRVTEDIPAALANVFTVVVDCGNGAASTTAPQVYRAMGHDVIELFCDIDGHFPNHHPDPSQPQNLEALIAKVKDSGADLGFAFDGDGDRLGVVDAEGNIIWPDRQLMLLARDVLSRNPGAPIIFDVKCSRYLRAIIQSAGGRPLMWKTGHSLIKGKMKELNAPLAGEMSGHIFFSERWYGFDDAIYTGARMLEVLARHEAKPTAVFAELPSGLATPELRIPLPENRHSAVMQSLRETIDTTGGELNDVDGLRVDYADGWGLVRPSNTSPYLVARFEAEDQAAMDRIQAGFRAALNAVDSALNIPF